MGKLIIIMATLAILATSTDQLPRILMQFRIAQMKLIKEFQASKWPKAIMPPKIKSMPYTRY